LCQPPSSFYTSSHVCTLFIIASLLYKYNSLIELVHSSINSTLVWSVPLAQVWTRPRPQLIFPSTTWVFGIYLNFQRQKLLKNQYLPHFESKSYQINSIKSCSSRSFQ
jgi:hypothetical protein